MYVYSKIQTILNESYHLTIGKYQIHWYYITRTTRQHGRAVLASKFFSADPSAPFAFVPHRSVVYSIRIWQHVHTISKRLTCYWQGHMMCVCGAPMCRGHPYMRFAMIRQTLKNYHYSHKLHRYVIISIRTILVRRSTFLWKKVLSLPGGLTIELSHDS